MTIYKKITISVFAFLIIAASFFGPLSKPTFAQGSTNPWYNQSYNEWHAKVFDTNEPEIFGERYTYAQVTWIVHSLTAIVLGQGIGKCLEAVTEITALKSCLENSSNSPLSYSSPIITTANLSDAIMGTKVASGVAYFRQKASDFHLITQAHAQEGGFGFQTLQPILPMWKAVRNISFMLLTVIFIAFAFMIMFRVKISPQTIITVQSSLPRVAIILIAIAFSYAIAGFVIDLSYLAIGLFTVLLKTVGNDLTSLGTTDLFARLSNGTTIVQGLQGVNNFIGPLGSLLLMLLITGIFIASVGALFGFATFGISFGLGGIILLIFVLLALFIALRILWLMIRTFVTTIFLIIIGPLMILGGALPNNALGIGSWIRALIANVAVFPTILIMIFIGHFLFWKFLPSVVDFGNGVTLPLGQVLGGSELLNPFKIPVSPGAGLAAIGFPGFSLAPIAASIFGALGTLLLIPSAGGIVRSLIQGKPLELGFGGSFGLPVALGRGQLGATAARIETENRNASAGTKKAYVETWQTKALRSAGVIK